MHVRENKTWKDDTDFRVQANHESAMRVRESFAGELRQIEAAIAEGQRGQDLKWQVRGAAAGGGVSREGCGWVGES